MLAGGSASLLFNLYGPRGAAFRGLEEDIARLFTLTKTGMIYQGGEAGGEILLHAFDPVAAQDSTVIQLAVNAPGPVEQAWEQAWAHLEPVVSLAEARKAWGISVVYQAEWKDSPRNSRAFAPEFAGISLPGLPVGQRNHLAISLAKDGAAALVSCPDMGGQLLPGSVYLVLVPSGVDSQYLAENFLGPAARFILPDLICHKGYHQQAQWHNDIFLPQYRKRLEEMMDASHKAVLFQADGNELAKALEALARTYEEMSITLAHMERLSVSLDRQLHNLAWWLDPPAGMEIFLHQQQRLQNAFAELGLAIREGRTVWEASQRAVAIVSTRLQAEQERRQERFTILLAILGVVLAVPQVIDREAAAAILHALGVIEAQSDPGVLFLLAAQLVILVTVGIVLAFALRLILRRKWGVRGG